MRFLLDVGIGRSVAGWLVGEGHDAVHLVDLGLERLTDSAIASKARDEARIIMTTDLDFGVLSTRARDAPLGVIIFRSRHLRPQRIIERLTSILPAIGKRLEHGAIVVIEEARYRVRPAPPRLLE